VQTSPCLFSSDLPSVRTYLKVTLPLHAPHLCAPVTRKMRQLPWTEPRQPKGAAQDCETTPGHAHATAHRYHAPYTPRTHSVSQTMPHTRAPPDSVIHLTAPPHRPLYAQHGAHQSPRILCKQTVHKPAKAPVWRNARDGNTLKLPLLTSTNVSKIVANDLNCRFKSIIMRFG
jgi:hypothetical protein